MGGEGHLKEKCQDIILAHMKTIKFHIIICLTNLLNRKEITHSRPYLYLSALLRCWGILTGVSGSQGAPRSDLPIFSSSVPFTTVVKPHPAA